MKPWMSVVLSCLLMSFACRDTELVSVPKTKMNANTGAGSDAKAGAGGSSGSAGAKAGSGGAKAGSGGSAGAKAGSGGGGGAAGDDGAAQVSRPGVYRGYSEA